MRNMMQRYPLTINKFLDHAAKWHSTRQVVCASPEVGSSRITYAELQERSLFLSGALLDYGLVIGDRVATLAWNTTDHLALYYATMGAGLVCHTLNPRLSLSHLAEMVNEADDRWIAVGAGLQSLLREILPLCPTIRNILLLDGQTADGAFSPQSPIGGYPTRSSLSSACHWLPPAKSTRNACAKCSPQSKKTGRRRAD